MAKIDRNQLLAERAQLLGRLGEIEAALKTLNASAVHIQTNRNIRNTVGLTTNPAHAGDEALVFEDEALTKLTSSANHDGWISAEDWAWIQANPEKVGDISLSV